MTPIELRAPEFGFVVQYVKDIAKARHFYEKVMGLRGERSHPTFVQFDKFAIASDAPMAGNGEPEIYWLVENAEAAFAALSSKAEVSLPLKKQPFGKVFGIRDAD